ncbi:AraC family transcriptional regulator [Acinetobacter baumannii]|uniref:AraC family transcriptional regulator n=1 Tax=Acinetobacter baumannii TaxID=470 RepID=UPI001C0C8C2E|nr:AraC family transcriptional regulator [Acinetobacter baumannii]EKV3804421.1 AraC family transcriptional regulator [Acinetobacter baumannii]EKW1170627.1 AraC family transcriptional regulator [Acinetobacter baumannii]MBU3816163.1 AraC family transcriptional regulator [Acinetobacter baumannii]MDC4316529.1 AraC family transcriptional regulator [Acinetobacter baumannii]MDC4735799.1 AraC family transcriptional regulator [Acinetobacter baumannii]
MGSMNAIPQTFEFWQDRRMPYVETRRSCFGRTCYKSHSHPTFSIGAIDEGNSVFQSSFGTAQKISAGTLVIVPAHVEHSCNPMPNQAWSYQMLHLDLAWLNQLYSEFQEQGLDLHIPQHKPLIIKEESLYEAFTEMNETLFDAQKLIFEKEQSLLHCLIHLLLPHFILEEIQKPQYLYKDFLKLIDVISSSEAFISLEELAQRVGLSRYAIIRLFKANVGLTPHAFQINLKINQAREQLKQGVPLAELAVNLGFSDQSHFHKAFKAHTGVTPRQFQLAAAQ